MFKDLTFDGVSLKDYGVYISGDAVYDSPERDVEMISIPGRNGTFALDKGRFNNIEVTYPAGVFAESQTNFADKMSALRNQLASRVGYKRIEDEYHSDEYRLGVYTRGLEFDPIHYNEASQFDITFNCKPQRFLKSGETPVSVASGDTITNPTLFDAHPLIKFNAGGNGALNIGDDIITVLNAEVGYAELSLTRTPISNVRDVVEIKNTSVYKPGDPITFKASSVFYRYRTSAPGVGNITSSNANGLTAELSHNGKNADIKLTPSDTTFTAGTPSTVSKSIDVTIETTSAYTKTFTYSIAYDGTDQFTVTITTPIYSTLELSVVNKSGSYSASVISSKATVDGDIYIDLDTGEAYGIDNGDAVSLNNYINLGSNLPVLKPGATTVAYSNTLSNVQITPRWWKI